MKLFMEKYHKWILGLLFLLFLPLIVIGYGNYNLFANLSKSEEVEVLQVLYVLVASVVILTYYGKKWISAKVSNLHLSFGLLNLFALISVVLIVKTIEHHLVMPADVYFLIIYFQITIVHIIHHLFYKTSV